MGVRPPGNSAYPCDSSRGVILQLQIAYVAGVAVRGWGGGGKKVGGK